MDISTLADLQTKLRVQQDYQKKNEEQSLLGADPTTADISEGGTEVVQLKEQARGSTGNLILTQYQNATQVASISENGTPSDLWTKWSDQRMAQKLRLLVRDRKVSAVGFMLVDKIDDVANPNFGQTEWKVLSPKFTITSSDDIVNKEYPDFAATFYVRIEDGKKVNYARGWDNETVTIFRQNGNSWDVSVAPKPHGAFACPIIPSFEGMMSDGVSHSLFEMISPALKNERTVLAQLGQLTWFNAFKQLIISGVSAEDLIQASEGVMSDNSIRTIQKQLKGGQDRAITIATNENRPNDPVPTVTQLQEGNLQQLIDAAKFANSRIASLASLPASVFDPGAYGSSTEATQQEWRLFDVQVRADELDLTVDLLSMFKLDDAINGATRDYTPNISWAPATPGALLTQGDNVSKLKATGMPLPWIAKYGLNGYPPEAITELIEMLKAGEGQPVDVADVSFNDALGG